MKVVWELDQAATVRDVYEKLLERRRIAYTTVMTMMKILEDKGYLEKSQEDRAIFTVPQNRSSRSCAGWSANSSTASSTARPSLC